MVKSSDAGIPHWDNMNVCRWGLASTSWYLKLRGPKTQILCNIHSSGRPACRDGPGSSSPEAWGGLAGWLCFIWVTHSLTADGVLSRVACTLVFKGVSVAMGPTLAKFHDRNETSMLMCHPCFTCWTVPPLRVVCVCVSLSLCPSRNIDHGISFHPSRNLNCGGWRCQWLWKRVGQVLHPDKRRPMANIWLMRRAVVGCSCHKYAPWMDMPSEISAFGMLGRWSLSPGGNLGLLGRVPVHPTVWGD